MSLLAAPAVSPNSSPLALLMAAVLPEHRGDVLVPEAGHPLVDHGRCRVPDCPGVATAGRGLCVAHADRWYRARRQGVAFESWLRECPPRCTPQACLVPDCRYGRHRSQLWHLHHTDWTAAAATDNAAVWAATVKRELDDQPGCQVPGCDLWASFSDGFCVSHQGRFNAFRRRSATDEANRHVRAGTMSCLGRVRPWDETPMGGRVPQSDVSEVSEVFRWLS